MMLCVFAGLETAHGEPHERVQQEEFVISYFISPPLSEARYQEIAEANINVGILGGHRPPADREEVTGYFEQFGMRWITFVERVPIAQLEEELADTPQCLGYFLADEPNATEFVGLAKKAEAIRAIYPGRWVYANLYPNWATTRQLGVDTYEEYVDQYLETVQPDILSFDHYPIMRPDEPFEPRMQRNLNNLALIRAKALEYDIPFWVYINTIPYAIHSAPTEAQMRLQINTALAYGAKGILYFSYYTLPNWREFNKGGALLTADERKTVRYYHVQRINEELLRIGPVLMALTSEGVYRIGKEDDPDEVLKETDMVKLSKSEPEDPPHNYLIGTFLHDDGRRVVMINNFDFAYSAWPTVAFDAEIDEIVEVCRRTGEEIPLVDDSPRLEGIQISLDASESRLFLLPPAKE